MLEFVAAIARAGQCAGYRGIMKRAIARRRRKGRDGSGVVAAGIVGINLEDVTWGDDPPPPREFAV